MCAWRRIRKRVEGDVPARVPSWRAWAWVKVCMPSYLWCWLVVLSHELKFCATRTWSGRRGEELYWVCSPPGSVDIRLDDMLQCRQRWQVLSRVQFGMEEEWDAIEQWSSVGSVGDDVFSFC